MALSEFLQRILPRLRRAQLARVLVELFGDLDARALADLLIELALDKYPILAFSECKPIIEIGYQSAREALALWVAGKRAQA